MMTIVANDYLAWMFICASIGCLWWFFMTAYHRYRVDLLRDRLFEQRDALFRAAMEAKDRGLDNPFESRAYIVTRLMINGMIRLAHEVSIIDLAIHGAAFRNVADAENELLDRFSMERQKAIEKVDDELFKEALESRLEDSNLAVASHILATSPAIAAVILPFKLLFWVIAIVARQVGGARDLYRSLKSDCESRVHELEVFRHLDSEAGIAAARIPAKCDADREPPIAHAH